MPRNTQLVELDLRGGVVTNESPYVIGRRLRLAQNCVWNYPYPRSSALNPTAWLLRQPLTFPQRAALAFTGAKSFRDIGFCFNSAATFDKYVALIGCNTSNQYAMWGDLGGAEIPFAGGVTRVTVSAGSKTLGCSAYWINPGTNPATGAPSADAVLVFSHPLATHVYYLLDAAASIRSLTTDTTNCPAGAAALAVHLDRLWLLQANATGTSKIWYTDPFNLDAIRTTNVVQVVGYGTCLIPGQYGAIDTSGVPHLIIGTVNAVYVLDGDPQLGGGLQADLRTLTEGVGMASSHVAALTPYGVFYLATDGNLWHIPLGCQAAVPVGESMRNVLGTNNLTGVLDEETGSVVWLNPYLYVYPGGETGYCYIAEPTVDGIARWWGPVRGDTVNTAQREAVVRAPRDNLSLHSPSGAQVTSLHSVDVTPVAAAARYLAFDPRTAQTGSYPGGANTNRAPSIQTGLINVPGHQVQPVRVILETMGIPAVSGNPAVWSVTLVDEKGTAYQAVRVPEAVPAVGTGDNSSFVAVQHFIIPGTGMPKCRAFSVVVATTFGTNLALHRALVEMHVTPEQF